ncbi:hypothetical protein FSP39_019656 [Pinctada imbricata]|uniref:SRCR domain-containing protein n=1 Tax=Pinctada imbricata TaxID=66713 RepID=A0AA89BV96_PINIB|nr:hypothetical protein FSP39_019656 [Pinctada imbricata]
MNKLQEFSVRHGDKQTETMTEHHRNVKDDTETMTEHHRNVKDNTFSHCGLVYPWKRWEKICLSYTYGWYKKVSDNTPCVVRHTQIRTPEGLFCLDDRSRFHIRKKKHVSKLVIKNPTLKDSGFYMCVASLSRRNITQSTRVTFHDKQIRFAGTSLLEGRIEVFGNGYWGTVCMNGLTDNEISTICKTLGFRYGGSMYSAWDMYYAARTEVGPIMVTGLKCPPNATDYGQCSHSGFGNLCCGCNHSYDLAIRCHERPVGEDNQTLRLSGYGRNDKGRVEILHNGSWILVDPYWLQFPEANMFCKMLGFRHGGEPILNETVPATKGIVLIHYIDCPSVAVHINNCSVTYSTRARMTSNAQGGVPTIPFRKARNNQGVEKLQYYKDGYWGTVCGAYIGKPEASMICHMMGFKHGGTLIKSYKDWSYKGLGPILLKYLDCPMNATNISQCPFRNYTSYSHRSACYSYIDHKKDVSISCNKNPVEQQGIHNGSVY